jgi:hypothetical protein
MSGADQFMQSASENEAEATESTKRERAGAGTSSRSHNYASNETYPQQSDKCNDRAEPCGWREMYHAMAVWPFHD